MTIIYSCSACPYTLTVITQHEQPLNGIRHSVRCPGTLSGEMQP